MCTVYSYEYTVQYTEYLVNIFKILKILQLTVYIDRFHFGRLHTAQHYASVLRLVIFLDKTTVHVLCDAVNAFPV